MAAHKIGQYPVTGGCGEETTADDMLYRVFHKASTMPGEETTADGIGKGRVVRWCDRIDIDFVLYLTRVIILLDPLEDCRMVGSRADWDGLPADKSLFCSDEGRGLPIGHLTSQLFSNVYLNEFDQFVKRQLTEQQCKAQTDYWLCNIVNLRNMNGPVPFQDMQPAFKAFGNEAEWANMTPAERDYYQHQLDMWYTNWAAWEYNREEGYEKGLAAGRAEGRAEGEAAGLEKGRAEIARAMKAKGIAMEVIAECTGLTAEDILRLE